MVRPRARKSLLDSCHQPATHQTRPTSPTAPLPPLPPLPPPLLLPDCRETLLQHFPTPSPPSTKDTVASDPLPRLLNVTLNGGGSSSSRGSSSQQSIGSIAVTQNSKSTKTTKDALTSPPSSIAPATIIPTAGQIPLVYGLTMLRETVIYIAFAILWLFGYARVSFYSFRRNLSRVRPCPLSFFCRPQCLTCGF